MKFKKLNYVVLIYIIPSGVHLVSEGVQPTGRIIKLKFN